MPGKYANFSATVTDPIVDDLTLMNVDMLEFQPLEAKPVYAPAEADTVETACVWVSVRVSVTVSVEDRVKKLVAEGSISDAGAIYPGGTGCKVTT